MNITNNRMDNKEIDLLEYWGIVLKRKWVLITFTLVIVVFTAVYSFTTTPLYKATATILIDEPGSSLLNIQDVLNSGAYYRPDYMGIYFNTQLRLLTSRSLADRVAKKMNLGARPEVQALQKNRPNVFQSIKNMVSLRWLFPGKKPTPSQASRRPPDQASSGYAGMVLGGVSIAPIEETRLVYVSHTSPSPVLATDIVNAHVEEFVGYSVETRYEATRQTSDFLSEQIAQLRDDLKRKEEDLQKYGEEKNLLFLNDDESSVVGEFSDVNAAYTKAQIDRVEKEALYRELNNLSIEDLPQFVDNPVIQSLKTTFTQLKSDYEEKSKFYRADYPDMVSLKTRLDSARTELESQVAKAIDAAEADYRAALREESSLKKLLEDQRNAVVQSSSNAILYHTLRTDVENMRILLSTLGARQNEIQVSSQLSGLRTSNIKIVDKAMVPVRPFTPNTKRNLLMALLVSLFGGLGLIYLVEYLDNTVKGPEDAEKLTGLASLGIIPYLSSNGIKKGTDTKGNYSYTYGAENELSDASMPEVNEIELINHLFPKFSIAEDYRTVRTSIQFSHVDNPPKTICFTSTLPQEGKTATVANLAVSFAQLEGKVLLIDADMRKPRLHKVFKLRNIMGLSSYLTGRVSFEEAVQKTGIENVWIIPSGPHPPNPAELLNSRRMKELIVSVKDRFDTILIDTPPVLAVIDPVIVSAFTDCTVFVVRAGKTTRRPMARAVEEIRKSKADIVGVVFNEVKIGRQGQGAPYYHYYQYEYSYSEKSGKPDKKEKRPDDEQEKFTLTGNQEN